MKYKVVRGTRDIVSGLMRKFDYLEGTAKNILKSYGYEEVRTPIFEAEEVFTRSLGSGTDIVSKEMYTFTDKGERRLALRPEGTAPLVRAAIENDLLSKGSEQRIFYTGAMFRYDRPQAGRYRQFYQIGAEIFGKRNALVDFEIIELAVRILENVGLDKFKLHINTVGCNECRSSYIKVLEKFVALNHLKLCKTCNDRRKGNILRIFDCKSDVCKDIMKKAPMVSDYVCKDCRNDFKELKKYLENMKLDFIFDKSLVRGLDYYTGTVFELKTDLLGAQDALAAGGRYDNLVKELGGPSVPAAGFGIGEDRVIEVLDRIGVFKIREAKKIFFVAKEEDRAEDIFSVFDLISELRGNGFFVKYDTITRSIKAQMRSANDWHADYVVFIEKDGLALKNMETGDQKLVEDKKEIYKLMKN